MREPKDIDGLIEALQGDSDPLLRVLTAKVLGELGDPRAREALQNCLVNDALEVSAAARTALGQLEVKIVTGAGIQEKQATEITKNKQEGCKG